MVHFEFLNNYPVKQKIMNISLIIQVPPIIVTFLEILNIIFKRQVV